MFTHAFRCLQIGVGPSYSGSILVQVGVVRGLNLVSFRAPVRFQRLTNVLDSFHLVEKQGKVSDAVCISSYVWQRYNESGKYCTT